jgi:hypothetical protein
MTVLSGNAIVLDRKRGYRYLSIFSGHAGLRLRV